MEIQSSIERKDNVSIFIVENEKIDHNNAASLKEKLFLEIADGLKYIILDIAKVAKMDSSGMGALLFGKRQADNAAGNLILVGVQPEIQTMLRIAQLARVFETFSTVDDALNSVKS